MRFAEHCGAWFWWTPKAILFVRQTPRSSATVFGDAPNGSVNPRDFLDLGLLGPHGLLMTLAPLEKESAFLPCVVAHFVVPSR